MLKAAVAATIAHQSEIVPEPSTKDTFSGLRLSADAERKVRFLPYGIAISVLDAPE